MKLYRPSNGTEGLMFQEKFCDICIHDKDWREKEKNPCEIMTRTMVLDIEHKNYPREWRYDEDGSPTCTAFEKEVGM